MKNSLLLVEKALYVCCADRNKVIEYTLSGEKLEVIDIPPGYTHNVENIVNRFGYFYVANNVLTRKAGYLF